MFHNAAKVREMRNTIREITFQTKVVVTSQEDIKTEAERFFSYFLSHEPADIRSVTVEEMEDILGFQGTDVVRTQLIEPITDEEIREVLFRMPSNKSPGPNRYTTEFFKASRRIIGKDFTTTVHSFFSKGFLPKGLNTTILALIPKKDIPIEM